MFSNILAPLDTADLSKVEGSLKLAKHMATPDAEITVLNVVEELPNYVLAELSQDVVQRSRDKAQKAMIQAVRDTGIDAKLKFVNGHAANGILDYAEGNNNDLIVIASHKPGMLDALLGSTASRVVRSAKCNVMVTR